MLKGKAYRWQIILPLVWIVITLASCAQVVAPNGGSKDETPPKVLRTYPLNKTTNFNAPKIVLQFDEFVILNNANDQVIISPPLDTKPEFALDHKKLIIDLKGQKLKPNSTYTINFGNAIGDLHENNILQNLTYVFSTGSVLDSLKVTGICVDANLKSPSKKFLVGLYPANETDSIIFNSRPIYFTRTQPNGSFEINNIPSNKYRVVAFEDENNNLKYNSNESIGFLKEFVNTSDTVGSKITLRTFKPDQFVRGKLLDTISYTAGRFSYIVYKPFYSKLSEFTGTKPMYVWLDHVKTNIDTITVFTSQLDTIMGAIFELKDSTYSIKTKTKKQPKNIPFLFTSPKSLELNDSLNMVFNTPLQSFDTARIIFKEDTLVIKSYYAQISADRKLISIYYPWQETKKYSLEIKDSAFTSIYKQYSKSFKNSWITKALKDYSSLKLFIQNTTGEQVIMQLVNETETRLIKEAVFNGSITLNYTHLTPGSFKIKFIVDKNKNGLWDCGNYMQQQLPESVYYVPDLMVLRAFWDIEQSINISELID